jgi:catechol 2,3-dioxygenase-like lactoylglutathione lyase family enzyme
MTRIVSLSVADAPEVWKALGFTVIDRRVQIGSVGFVLEGQGDQRGITSWMLSADDGELPPLIDGLLTGSVVGSSTTGEPPPHPNGIVAIDHIVVSTPDIDRTVGVLEDLGWECRRRREGAAYGQEKMHQAFFWLDDVILEVVGPETLSSVEEEVNKPATFFGIALTAYDLSATQAFFGDLMKPPVEAVQPGRFITTISSRGGSSLAIAVMSPHQ